MSCNNEAINMHLGLQLHSILGQLGMDFDGALARVAAAGFRRVEMPSSAPGARTPKDAREALDNHGLVCPSMHFAMMELIGDLDSTIASARAMGARFMVCGAPWIRDVSRVKVDPKGGKLAFFLAIIAALDLDDWRWNADELNRVGSRIKAEGLQLAYHSHNFEFRRYGDVVAYDELLRLTDPDLVKLELDCGWIKLAGHDPVTYLTNHATRCSLLHTRDFAPGFTPTTELTMTSSGFGAGTPAVLGEGVVDYPAVFAAARQAGTVECFIEREPAWDFLTGRPRADADGVFQVLEQDYAAARRLGAGE